MLVTGELLGTPGMKRGGVMFFDGNAVVTM